MGADITFILIFVSILVFGLLAVCVTTYLKLKADETDRNIQLIQDTLNTQYDLIHTLLKMLDNQISIPAPNKPEIL